MEASLATPGMVSFVVYGKAQPAGSKRVFHAKDGHAYVRDMSGNAGDDWRRSVAQAAGIAMMDGPLLTGPLKLILIFYVVRPQGHYGSGRNAEKLKPSAPMAPTTRPDLTKLIRAVEDAMTGIVWRDDSQVVIQEASKVYSERARVKVTVLEVG